jgi:hypothetical protein
MNQLTRRRRGPRERHCSPPRRVDLSKERVGRPPETFEPIVGTWVVAQDGADKVIMVDGRPWVAQQGQPDEAPHQARASCAAPRTGS